MSEEERKRGWQLDSMVQVFNMISLHNEIARFTISLLLYSAFACTSNRCEGLSWSSTEEGSFRPLDGVTERWDEPDFEQVVAGARQMLEKWGRNLRWPMTSPVDLTMRLFTILMKYGRSRDFDLIRPSSTEISEFVSIDLSSNLT